MKLIERKTYLKSLINVAGTPDIKVITGIRRAGKSKLLLSFSNYIKAHDETANIISIDFNMLSAEPLLEYHALFNYVQNRFIPNVNNYLMIDEIQMCSGFEKAINSLHATENYDIYLTGSNAFLMSSDLATLFTGRTFQIEVFPFSLAEYMDYFAIKDPNEALTGYLRAGGLSGSYVYKTEGERMSYLSAVYKTLILRDITLKHRIRNATTLNNLSNFMMDNVGNVTSSRALTNKLGASHDMHSNKTITSYVDYLCEAFLFYKVARYDMKGKKYLSTSSKYYLADHALRYAELGFRNMDYGRVYENIVALELRRRGWDIYAGILYKNEIDFVAMKGNEKIYIQVCDNVSSNEVLRRETAPLLKIHDAYPKMIIARTQQETHDHEGITIHNLASWLVNEN